MQPSEALSTAAQVSVTLAGFAGIVVVFRSGALHEWSALDKLRLRILLTNSVLPLAMCLIGMLLLSTNLSQSLTWRCSSGFAAALIIMMSSWYSSAFRTVPPEEIRKMSGSRAMFSVTAALVIGAVLLQFYNIGVLAAFWPFFVAIVILIGAAVTQFVRMIILHEGMR